MRIGDLNLTWPRPGLQSAAAPVDTRPTVERGNPAIADSVRVSLSARAERSQQAADSKDVDESDLPDLIKQLLKHIRELKLQVTALQQEMAELARQPGLSDEDRAAQMDLLRTELSSLSAALTSAYGALSKAMQQQGLSDEQRTSVLALMNP